MRSYPSARSFPVAVACLVSLASSAATAAAQVSVAVKAITETDCTAAKLASAIPVSAIGEPVSAVRKHVKVGSTLNTDAFFSYAGLQGEYTHKVIDHAEVYVDGTVHTNGCENFWSLLKRMIRGTYVSIEPFHLFRYLDEEGFRFNNRKRTDRDRFVLAAASIIGKRLTYRALTGHDLLESCPN